jgi:Chitobiase/beta-hexosaminidase C-terminal domain/Bacterial Ig-like domain (group 2)
MRISLMPRVCSGLLCGGLLLFTGCSNPSSQNLASLSVTATPTTLSVGGAAVLHAVAHLSDGTTQDVSSSTTWTVSNPTLGTVTSGSLNAKAAGTLTVQAAYIEVTPAGTSPVSSTTSPEPLTASATVTIMPAGSTSVPTITWATPAPIAKGTPLSATQLNATANVPGTFEYSPAAGTVLAIGSQTLSAVFTPSNSKEYSSATATVQLSVGQTAPVITWATPAAITAGTALSATQLNAKANVPGKFVYSPAAGAVLGTGTQTLNAAFTPTDTTNYASATAKVSILVNATSAGGSGSGTSSGPVGPVGPAPTSCGGPTINLNAGMSTGAIQSAISSAPNCSLIVFAAGTYNITNQLNIPCNNLQITGPVAANPTAVLAATYTNNDIFAYNGDCSNLGSVSYLHFENTGALFFGSGSDSNFKFQYNVVTHLPSLLANNESESGIYFAGSMKTTVNNIVIQFNTFGDESSCTTAYATNVDEGGYCAGVLTGAAKVENLTIHYNKFIHVEEGIHINQLTSFAAGQPNSVCVSCDIQYNFISGYHRIGIEIQVSTPTNPILLEHNSIVDPISSSYGTYAVSMACCQFTDTYGTAGNDPGYIFHDNVLVATLPIGSECPPFGVEFWGNGPQGSNSLIQGTFCNGYTWGYGGGNWSITNNYICGPNFGKSGAGYISNEEHTNNPPSMSNNKMTATCEGTPSTAPSISPAGGSFSGSQLATLSDPGENTSIWYTTDGSTPVPGQGTAQMYTAPFKITSSTTVKAVGMWGSYNQPTSYPAGYGYVPSSVVTASFVSASAIKAPSAHVAPAQTAIQPATSITPTTAAAAASSGASAAAGASSGTTAAPGTTSPTAASSLQTLVITPSTPELTIGGTTQLKAEATFSDGSTRDVTSDVTWQSSDPRTIAVTAPGAFSGLATGKAMLIGSWEGRQAAVQASSSVGQVDWSAPIVINQGGTYSGNWQSTDGKTAAVTITTTDPVILQDAHLSSNSNLIKVTVAAANVTVRNSVGVAVSATAKGQPNGVFLDANAPARLDVENNYMENVRDGVLVTGYKGSRSDRETLVIRGNRARNLNGMLSNGAGGYLPGEGTNRALSRFIEIDNVQSVPGVDVGWNEVVNYPTHSLVSDVISVYRSSGTPNAPLEVHDSYIQGAYAYKPGQDTYSGGGIKTEGAADDTAANASAFTSIHDNQVVGTSTYGIEFHAGHDNVAANNRVISSGLLADGTKIAAQRVGLRGASSSNSVYNNTMHDNLVGWSCWTTACSQQGYRRDQYFPASPGDYATNSRVVAGPISLDTEGAEYQLWLNKTASDGIKVGPTF